MIGHIFIVLLFRNTSWNSRLHSFASLFLRWYTDLTVSVHEIPSWFSKCKVISVPSSHLYTYWRFVLWKETILKINKWQRERIINSNYLFCFTFNLTSIILAVSSWMYLNQEIFSLSQVLHIKNKLTEFLLAS